MSTGVRLFHYRASSFNYVLIKPKENKVYLYQLNKDGSIDPNAKPLMTKTYKEYTIERKASFPYAYQILPSRYNKWKSSMPRRNLPFMDEVTAWTGSKHLPQVHFSIKNKDGFTNSVINIEGSINQKGEIGDISKLNFPLDGINSHNFTNLAKIYFKKVLDYHIAKTIIYDRFYISDEERKMIDAEGIPPFKVTDKMRESMETLAKKHKIKIVV